MTVLLCRHCGRPCLNGTGRAAHERACQRGGGSRPALAAVKHEPISVAVSARPGIPVAPGTRVCAKCRDEYQLGELAAHLAGCTRSATYRLAQLRGEAPEPNRAGSPACRRCGRPFERRNHPGRYPSFCSECR